MKCISIPIFFFATTASTLSFSVLAEEPRGNLRASKEEARRQLDYNPYEEEEISIYDGDWGGWKGWKTELPGYYACGASIRYESFCGSCDDTAANGLKLKFCSLINWYEAQREEVIYGGVWGRWSDYTMCPPGQYIIGGNVRYEDHCGRCDDTSLNGLQIACIDKNSTNYSEKVVTHGNWGDWKGWKKAKEGKLVKAANVRFEDPQGSGDDTAMNGIRFKAEKPNFGVSKSGITGEWQLVGSGGYGLSHSVTYSTTLTTGESTTKEFTFGFEETISVGFKFLGMGGSVDVTASQSWSTAKTMSKELSNTEEITVTHTCPYDGSNDDTIYYMYQWVMQQPQDQFGIGFHSKTNHFRCTRRNDDGDLYELPPQCVLGYCADVYCQECISNTTLVYSP